jgi:hypothetical protein
MRQGSADLDYRMLMDLHGRVARLEGVAAGLAAQGAQRVMVLKSLRERLQAGTVERGLVDLLFTLERDASRGLESADLAPAQRGGYVRFASAMQRLTRGERLS